jgi:hypothetical protein
MAALSRCASEAGIGPSQPGERVVDEMRRPPESATPRPDLQPTFAMSDLLILLDTRFVAQLTVFSILLSSRSPKYNMYN